MPTPTRSARHWRSQQAPVHLLADQMHNQTARPANWRATAPPTGPRHTRELPQLPSHVAADHRRDRSIRKEHKQGHPGAVGVEEPGMGWGQVVSWIRSRGQVAR